MSSVYDGKVFTNIAATTAAFYLKGGNYGATAVATFGGGSVKLQMLLADGTTWQSPSTGTDFTTAGYASLYLIPGQYRFTIATATVVYCSVTGIPS